MIVNKLLATLLKPYLLTVAPNEGGGAADRGDDFTPTLDDEEEDTKPDTKAKKDDAEEEEEEDPKAKKDDAEEEEEEEDDKKSSKPRIRIPKERLDQEIAKRRAAEQRAAERIQALEQQIEQQRKDANVDALEKELTKLDEQYDDAIADGEKAKAKEIKAKMRELERKITRAEAVQASLQGKQAAVAEIRYDIAVSDIELDYPELNPDTDAFDPDKAEEVMDLLEAYKARGIAPDVALRRSVRYVMGPPKRLVEKLDEAPDPEKDGLRRKEAVKDERAVDARKKVADAARKQPPSTSKVGADSDKMGGGKMTSADIAKLSYDQFTKLDEETKAKLRGDDL